MARLFWIIHIGPMKSQEFLKGRERGESESGKVRWPPSESGFEGKTSRSCAVGIEHGGQSQQIEVPPGSWKMQKHRFFEVPEEMQSNRHLDFNTIKAILDFWLQKPYDKFVLFQAFKLIAIGYRCNRKLMHRACRISSIYTFHALFSLNQRTPNNYAQ